MPMPKTLVLIRHGESEQNVFNKEIKHGKRTSYPDGFLDIPDREFRLSEKGREQTFLTGKYLAEHYPEGFDSVFASDHIRAQETAALVLTHAGFFKQNVSIDPQLGERRYGSFDGSDPIVRSAFMLRKERDPLHAVLPSGETLLDARLRSRNLLGRCFRQHEGQNVLVFSHGEFIECVWSEIAHYRTEIQREFFAGEGGDIKNCQIVEFSSEDGKFRYVKSSNPHFAKRGEWRKLEPQYLSIRDLMDNVANYKHFIKKEIE